MIKQLKNIYYNYVKFLNNTNCQTCDKKLMVSFIKKQRQWQWRSIPVDPSTKARRGGEVHRWGSALPPPCITARICWPAHPPPVHPWISTDNGSSSSSAFGCGRRRVPSSRWAARSSISMDFAVFPYCMQTMLYRGSAPRSGPRALGTPIALPSWSFIKPCMLAGRSSSS